MELEAPQRVDIPVSNPQQLSATDSAIYFSGYDAEHGHELWLSDGTTEGTNLVTDLVPGEASSAPEMIQVMEDGSLYFTAVDSAHGRELWWLPSYVGDLDGDYGIDFADFLLFADRYGKPGTPDQGDFDLSGVIDFADFLIFAANFGRPL
jgi:ELWxxDGT repeat protein